jgi:hypothetical protein
MSEITETSELIRKCLFCPLGDPEKRGILKVTIKNPKLPQHRRIRIGYKCALGEEGAECVIPDIYAVAYRGTQTGRAGDFFAEISQRKY